MSRTTEELFAQSDSLLKRAAELSAKAAGRSRYNDVLVARSAAMVKEIRELIARLPRSGLLNAPADNVAAAPDAQP